MRPLLQTAAREGQATISPDGQSPRHGPKIRRGDSPQG